MFYKFDWNDSYMEERKGDTFLKESTRIPYDSLVEVDSDEFYNGRTIKELSSVCISSSLGNFISLPFIIIKDNSTAYVSISDLNEKLVSKYTIKGVECYITDECTILKNKGLWDFGDVGDPLN